MSFFRFCWKNGKLDWPKCARTTYPYHKCIFQSAGKKRKRENGQEN